MTPDLKVMAVGLAAYALVSAVLSLMLAFAWQASARRWALDANAIFLLRLAPAVLGATVSAGVVLPSFVRFEPHDPWEAASAVVLGLAWLAVACLSHGAFRAWRATRATRALAAGWSAVAQRTTPSGTTLDVIDAASPIVAIVGIRRPRVVAARRVVEACTADELARIAAHEQAHGAARDNLKRLLLIAAPDVLAWLPASDDLLERWHVASEEAADAAAAGRSREARLQLASALIKVARLAAQNAPAPGLASGLIGVDGIEHRVRRLLSGDLPPTGARPCMAIATLGLLPWLAIPWHPRVHALTELLMTLGR